ncbi:restriction endonuclease [Stappia sp. GBMRC 2046]|uniref:Restriction endonuclease n=1 Tax=Stappia sediminis TaxID=2692190 RepID=A0A7X3LX74_9HYPH|nr:HNH endonuclease [Stappia sediminis]MXN66715.1 restriction endonuclease [Stappia sediminis]
MAKAVLITKIDPTYDDLPEERYHFPRTYLRQAEAALGDWVLYYEPRRRSGDLASVGGRQSYFATARLTKISADPATPDHFYAHVADYLEFDRAVPFKDGAFYYEGALRKEDGTTNKGAFGRAVRNLPDREYDLILQAGFAHVLGREERMRPLPDRPEEPLPGFAEEGLGRLEPELPLRNLEKTVSQRPFRDRAFAVAIKNAYRDTCAVTGLKIINGGGRSEVQAAHIRPVADLGPDSVRNGIALSGTVHWMFDRGLISVDDDYRILTAGNSVPDTVSRLINPDRRLLLPSRIEDRPHPHFLKYHREAVFKG